MITNSPTLPAPASASAHLHPAPTSSVGGGADATLPDPTFPSRVSVNSAAPKVPRGAAVFSFPIPASRVSQAVVTSLVGAVADVTAATRARSNISVVPHSAHRVLAHTLPVAHFSSDCVSAHRDADDSDNCNHNQIDNHFHHSAFSMLGVNTA